MRVAGIVILALLVVPSAGDAAQAHQPGLVLVDTAVLQAPLLTESSGVVASNRPGVFWTINDSGNRPLLLATDTTGRDLGFIRVRGARNRDWEELAAGPCPRQPASRCLYIADIGDNAARRRVVVVYVLPEPDPPGASDDTTREHTVTDSLVLRYPDRPHDAEAMVIQPRGTLLLITKDRFDPPLLFRAPIDTTGGIIVMQRLGELPIAVSAARGRLVTGAALSPDGSLLAVRTYISIHLFRISGPGLPRPLHSRGGVIIPVVESQGEAITFVGPETLVLTSERGSTNHGIITRLRITGLATP